MGLWRFENFGGIFEILEKMTFEAGIYIILQKNSSLAGQGGLLRKIEVWREILNF